MWRRVSPFHARVFLPYIVWSYKHRNRSFSVTFAVAKTPLGYFIIIKNSRVLGYYISTILTAPQVLRMLKHLSRKAPLAYFSLKSTVR